MKVLVTGSAQGIGLAIVRKFIQEGYQVIGFDIKPSSFTHENYTHYLQDIREELPEIEGIDILINNAGVQEEESAIEVNLVATMKVTETYGVREGIKSIVFITSASARNGAEFPVYSASKGGIVAYMKNVALRVAKYKATCNGIAAGGVITPLNAHILNDESLYAQVLNETLLGKWAEAEEVADLAYYLSVINRSITGEDILMDNGEMLKSDFIW